MKSKLIVCQGNNLPEIENPSPEQIERALDDLIPAKYHFVILVSEEPVQNCAFVQTIMTQGNAPEIKYLFEIQFKYDDTRFKQYEYYTTNVNELKKMFRMFALGILPDITGWKDITEEVLEEIAEQKKKADEQSA